MRCTLDLGSGTAKLEQRDDRISEFPRIDDRLAGLPARYLWMVNRRPGTIGRQFQSLLRYDLDADRVIERDGGSLAFGEPAFAPRIASQSEGDGYVMTFATDVSTLKSFFVVLDAADLEGPPAAVLAIPHRVPLGLHGNWFASPL
jgi:carotenoid cleavage dioxygenase